MPGWVWNPALTFRVSVDQVIGYLNANAEMAQLTLRGAVRRVSERRRDCACVNALQYAIMTDPAMIPPKTRDDLAPIIGKYISSGS